MFFLHILCYSSLKCVFLIRVKDGKTIIKKQNGETWKCKCCLRLRKLYQLQTMPKREFMKGLLTGYNGIHFPWKLLLTHQFLLWKMMERFFSFFLRPCFYISSTYLVFSSPQFDCSSVLIYLSCKNKTCLFSSFN